ncbi:MAG: hypothetical protein ACPLWB_01035 [Caldisericia bacterium]
MIFERFKELSEFKDEKGISLYSTINVTSYKNEILSFAKKGLENLSNKVDKNDLNFFISSKNNLLNHLEAIRIKGKSLYIFSTPKKVYENFYDFPLRNEIYFGLPNLYQFYWALIENPEFGIVNITLNGFEFHRINLYKESGVIKVVPSVDTSSWRRKHIMPPPSPKGGVTIGAVGGGNLKDAYEERLELHIYKILKEFKSNVLKNSENLRTIFVASDSEEKIDDFLNIEPNSDIFVKLTTFSNATMQDILNISIDKLNEIKKIDEEKVLNELFNRASTSNLGGVGISSSLKFIQDGRVKKILISENFSKLVNICKKCSYVYFEKEFCPSCNSNEFNLEDLRFIIHNLCEKYKSELYIVHGENAKKLDLNGGIGFFLRY